MRGATTDPGQLHRRVTAGRLHTVHPARIATARAATARAGHELDLARTGVDAAWTGSTARTAQRALDASSAALLAADAELAVAGDLLTGLARAQAEVRGAADRLLLSWLATVATRALTDPVTTAGVTSAVARELLALQAHLDAELARAAAAFDALAGGAARAAGPNPAAPPRPRSTPGDVARWWAARTVAEQAALERSSPDALAALAGLPPVVLDRVNRVRLERDRRAAAVLLATSPPPGPDRDRAWAATAAAAALVRAADAPGPVLLLSYAPEVTRGIAVALGDPSSAGDVAVTVPGTGSGPTAPRLEQARALREAMDTDDPTGSHAVVQWLDYGAPVTLLDPRVAGSDLAGGAAADRLVADVDGWRAAHDAAGGPDRQHVTVVGHSYGSTLVGLAATRGLAADDVAFVGSPGVGAGSAAELSPGVGHVWAAAAEHDPVVQLTGGSHFSPDGRTGPYDPEFGARVFAAPDTAGLGQAHSTYYEPGSESLHNLAAIATGRPEAVTAGAADTGWGSAAADEAGQDLRGHLGEAVVAVRAGDTDGLAAAGRGALEDVLADTGDAVVGGLGQLGEGVRGLAHRLGAPWDALG